MKTLPRLTKPSRRSFLKSAALIVTVTTTGAFAQVEEEGGRRGNRAGRGGGRGGAFGGGGGTSITARLRLNPDNTLTLLSGKVECGQGARAELAQAAAEELRLPLASVTAQLCDTDLTPNDGGTFGSQTTPRTLPPVRQAAAAMREILLTLAATHFSAQPADLTLSDGKIHHAPSNADISYADLANSDDARARFAQSPTPVPLTPTALWQIMGHDALRHDAPDMVTGRHVYPTDITRPGMLYGKILRPPAYGASLDSLAPPDAPPGIQFVHENQIAGVVAPTSFAAEQALAALAPTAKWSGGSTANSATLIVDLRASLPNGSPANPFADIAKSAPNRLTQSYFIPYVQHAPLEPRTAVAEWSGGNSGKLTVWTATQNPFSVRSELAAAFNIPDTQVRVIVPDFGGAFGGKHTGECAVEAATLAKAAAKPVMLRWSRAEEFTWAYFRPAALIDIDASLDASGKISSWHFVNINSGNAALDSPYAIPQKRAQYLSGKPPLRHGSYRGLAATANNFAREVAMDELAALAHKDPLAFRLDHLDDPRLRAVLQKAADLFDWSHAAASPNSGIGLACGTEKGSYVATAAQLHLADKKIIIDRIVHTFECGAIVNPLGLRQQVTGAIVQGLGPALFESIQFANGIVTNAAFAKYRVPRFSDLPPIQVELLNRPDLPSAGAGETPLITLAPALANALSTATATRHRQLPLTLA